MYSIVFLDYVLLPSALELVSRATERLLAQNIHQWDELYPDAATLGNDISQFTLRGLFDADRLIGILVLNEQQDPEYASIPWGIDDPEPLIVHRLCIDPAYQGKGLSKLLLHYAEEYARANGYRSIRLDAFSGNPISLGLYRSLGFIERGQVRFRKGMFHCFEKQL